MNFLVRMASATLGHHTPTTGRSWSVLLDIGSTIEYVSYFFMCILVLKIVPAGEKHMANALGMYAFSSSFPEFRGADTRAPGIALSNVLASQTQI